MSEHILYDPYDHQLAVHKAHTPQKFVMWPVRQGKDVVMVNDRILDTINKMPMWSQRNERDYRPKWNCWWVAKTYRLLEQLWRDVLAYMPKELFDKPPSPKIQPSDPKMYLKNDCIFSFRSGLHDEYLVAEGVDQLNITEAGELPTSAWELLQARASDASRLSLCTIFANGTPRGQVDPQDPTRDHWFWGEVRAARMGLNPRATGFYWFEDRKYFENREHGILSLTDEGRAELARQKQNPNLSERKFREDYMGECLPIVLGDPVIVGFNMALHIQPIEFQQRYKLIRSWDFGRNFPVVIFHQITKENVWLVHHEIVGIHADMLDTELADLVIETTNKYFRNTNGQPLTRGQVEDYGDFEATHKEDSRRESTIEMLKGKGVDLVVKPTRSGDELMAIEHINGRMKIRSDGSQNIILHPRCENSIRCFNGAWVYETAKIKGFEYRKDSIATIQPWIDIFDAFKYLITNVIAPHDLQVMRHDRQVNRPRTVVKTDKDGAPIGYREVG